MTNEQIQKTMDEASRKGFGGTARWILYAAAKHPVNPYRYFGRSMRRSWAYAYFARLEKRGFLKMVSAPKGCRGHHWYITCEV